MTKTLADITPEERISVDNRVVIAEALRAFGQAIRNDWTGTGPRTVKAQMEDLALLLVTNAPIELEELLDTLEIGKDADGEYFWKWWEE